MLTIKSACSSLAESLRDMQVVAGSIPVSRTMSNPPNKKPYRHCSRMRRLLGIKEVIGELSEREKQINKTHRENLFKIELIKVEPMKMPDLKIFSMDSRPNPDAEEDMVCRECKKVVIQKGEPVLSKPLTTHYLGHARGGGVEYSCHVCRPPKKRRIRSPRR
jgi:hypothetical protein